MDELSDTQKHVSAASDGEACGNDTNNEETSQSDTRNDEGDAKGKVDKDETKKISESKESLKRKKSQQLSNTNKSDKANSEQMATSSTKKRFKNDGKYSNVYDLKDDKDEDEEDISDTDEENAKVEEERWEAVTPQMLVDTIGKNSLWRAASTVKDVVAYLKQNYPVCQREEELTVEVSDKLTCAEEIGLVIKECVRDRDDGQSVVYAYRLSSPREETYLTEWEVKEFWSHYREIIRRSRREETTKSRARGVRSRRNGTTRSRAVYRGNQRKTRKRYQYRRRSPYYYSSEDSLDCGRDCCCRK